MKGMYKLGLFSFVFGLVMLFYGIYRNDAGIGSQYTSDYVIMAIGGLCVLTGIIIFAIAELKKNGRDPNR